MQTKFKPFAIVAMALAIGLASCSKDRNDVTIPVVEKGSKDVVVQVNVKSNTTRAVGNTTADNVTPNFEDLTLFFVGNGIVQQIETITTSSSTTTTYSDSFTVPLATEKVYAIGNIGTSGVNSPSVSSVSVGASESTIKNLMLEVDAQTSAEVLNLTQGQGLSGTAASGAEIGSSNTVSFNIMPAVARYEISEVSVASASDVQQPLSEFKLSAIYVTNTYRTLGLDYSTLPSSASDIINAGPGTSNLATAVPAYLQDQVGASTAATSFTPSSGSFWHYFVMPPIAGKGTTLEGSTTGQESSVPIIVLEITDAVSSLGSAPTYASPSYVNVRKFIRSDNSQELTYLEPGNVYIIDKIEIGGEHLTGNFGEDHDNDVTVSVTVQPWKGVTVKPGL